MSETFEERLARALLIWRGSPKRGFELAEPLDPSRDRIVGDPAAPIAVVEYACYGSPAGAREDRALRAPLREMLLERKICFAVRHFPLTDGSSHAWMAACAVEAADHQDRFWDLHEAISQALAQMRSNRLELSVILTLARDLGLDTDRLERDMKRPETGERILRDFESGVRSGVNGVPSFYVAGIRQIIERPEELVARLGRALSGDRVAL
jgi:protein-disulfide isomerase